MNNNSFEKALNNLIGAEIKKNISEPKDFFDGLARILVCLSNERSNIMVLLKDLMQPEEIFNEFRDGLIATEKEDIDDKFNHMLQTRKEKSVAH